jgi:hypothetical protein
MGLPGGRAQVRVGGSSMNVALFRDLAEAAVGLVYPDVCQICLAHKATPAEGYVCSG